MFLQFFIIVLIVGFFANDFIEATYATMTQNNPNVIITINSFGQVQPPEGDLFGNVLWYPGRAENGIIRIRNDFKPMKITNMAIDVDMRKTRDGYDPDRVYNSFIDHMLLTVKKGKLAIFDKDIIDSKTFRDLLYTAGNRQQAGVTLADSDQFYIDKNDYVDLKYTLLMDEDSGNELQSLSSKVSFLINVNELSVPVDPSDPDDPVDPRDPEEPLEEEPIEIIPDIAGHWAHDCIVTLLKHGIIKGYPDNRIRPNRPITRAEAAVLIGRALELDEQNKLFSGYIDYIPGWAKGYIIAVSEKEIFKGYPLKRFKANKNISRQEMVTVLIRGFKKELIDEELTFTDKDEIGEWALEFVKAGVHHEILAGYPDKSFKPKNDITRAEAFTIICKLLGLHDEHTDKVFEERETIIVPES